MIRKPAVAGYFYPQDPRTLIDQIQKFLKEEKKEGPLEKAIALISPHAGYMYSGKVAAAGFARVNVPSKLFILSPNHTGEGAVAAINQSGRWMTPLGEAKVDEELARAFRERSPLIEEDSLAHATEHSLEVQIPFVQSLNKDFSFVPLTVQHLSFEECESLGEALAQTISEVGDEILIIASSDMNHYESQEVTMKKDQVAIDGLLHLDPEELYREVHRHRVTMCGIIPTTIALIAAKKLGAKKAELIRHATSGDMTGDYTSVVGYASFVIS